MTWTHVGTDGGSNTAAPAHTHVAIGNLLVLEIIDFSNSTVWPTSVSGGGASWVQAGVKLSGSSTAFSAAVFLGTVTATGSATPTITWSGTTPANFGCVIGEFHSTVGSWAFDKQGNLDNSGGQSAWPSLTPANNGELYWGYCSNLTSAGTVSTPGYSFNQNADTTQDGSAYNLNCSAGVATNPVWSDAGQQFGIAILIAEGGAAGPDTEWELPRQWGTQRWRRSNRSRPNFQRVIPTVPAGAAAPVYTRVHSPVWSNSNTSGAALAVTVAPTNIGDLMVASVLNQGGTSVASLSGGGCTTWTRAMAPWTDPEATPSVMEWWYGVVSSTGSSSLSVTFNAAVGAHFNEVTVQDFHCSVSGTWTVDGAPTNQSNGTSSNTVTYPAQTPTHAPEIYVGYASTPSAVAASVPLPAGAVVGLTSGNDCFIYHASYSSGTVQNTVTISNTPSWSIGILFYMATGAVGTTWALAGTASNTSSATGAISLRDAVAGSASNVSSASGALLTPKMETLTDNFPGSAVDANKWGAFNTVSVASNTLTLTDTASSTLYSGINSANRYDLTGSYFLAHLTNGGGQFATTQAMLLLSLDANNSLSLFVNNGNLQAQTDIATTFTTRGSIAWVGATMSWLRIRESGGNILWDYSADGVSWTNLATLATPFAITALQATIQEGQYGGADPQATSTWQSVNLPPLPTTWSAAGTASNTSTASGTLSLTMPIAGTASNASSATGSLTLVAKIAGTASSTSTATGAFLPAPLAGTASTVSAASGALTLLAAIAGTAVTTSVTAGDISTSGAVHTTPYVVGVLATNATGTAFTIPVTAAMSTGDGLLVGSSEPGNGVISAVSDTKGNTWASMQSLASTPAVSAWAVTGGPGGAGTAVAPLTTSDTVSITFSVSDSVFKLFQLVGVPGTSGVDTAADAQGTGSSTSPATATLTLAGSGEFVVAFLSSANAGGAPTWSGSDTLLQTQHSGAGSYLSTAYRTAPTTSAVTPSATIVSASWRMAVIPMIVAPTSTTWTAAGTASNASSATGAFLPASIAGTASNVSSASGDVTLTPAVIAGTASNASAASGAFVLTEAIAGTATTVSQASGALTLLAAIAGTAPTVSIASGALTLLAKIAGTASSVSTATGAFLPAPIAGTASNTSLATGTLALRIPIAGTAANASTATGAFLPATLAGTAVTVSSATGAITSAAGPTTWSVAGTAIGTSTASGTFALVPAVIAGTAVTVSSASGAFLPASIVGTAATVSLASGALTLLAKIAGTASSVSLATGALTLTAVIAGTASTISSATGAFLSALIAGTSVTVSVASGTLALRLVIAGTAVSVSSASGALLPALIAGTAVTVSSATGAIITTTTRFLAGTASNTSTASGAVTLLAVLAGVAVNASTASGTLTLQAVIAGTAITVSSATGVLAPKVAFAGTASNVSVATGILTVRLILAGTAVTQSVATGFLVMRLALAGTAVTHSLASGALVSLPLAVLPDIIGCTVAILAYSGTVSVQLIGALIRVSTVECDHIDVVNLGISVEVR